MQQSQPRLREVHSPPFSGQTTEADGHHGYQRRLALSTANVQVVVHRTSSRAEQRQRTNLRLGFSCTADTERGLAGDPGDVGVGGGDASKSFVLLGLGRAGLRAEGLTGFEA